MVESMGFLNCTDGCLVPLGGGGQLRRGRPAGRGPKDLAIQPSTRSATFFTQEGKRLFCRREGKGSLTLRSHETFAGAGCFDGPATLLPPYARSSPMTDGGCPYSELADNCAIRERRHPGGWTDTPIVTLGCSLGVTIALRLAAQKPIHSVTEMVDLIFLMLGALYHA